MVHAIILAGGRGERCFEPEPKQFLRVGGKPIVCHTIERFERCELVDDIVVPCLADWCDRLRDLIRECGFRKVTRVLPGGRSRQESIRCGLRALPAPGADDIVLIHDGVRPLVSRETILENIRAAAECGAAMTVRKSTETVISTAGETARMEDFAERARTYFLTSPQSFRAGELARLYEGLDEDARDGVRLLDAAMLYASAGRELRLVVESEINPKVTTREDVAFLEFRLARGAGGRAEESREGPQGM